MKFIILLLLSSASLFGQLNISGRVSLSGNTSIVCPRVVVPVPDLVFSDFHYSDNFPSNEVPVFRTTNGMQMLVYWDDPGVNMNTGVPMTYDIYFKVQGASTLVTNWADTMIAYSSGDPGEITSVLDGHTTGYGTGSHVIISSVLKTITATPQEFALDSGAITPIATVYVKLQFNVVPASMNDALIIQRFQVSFNNPP